jgi:hypothetical protein
MFYTTRLTKQDLNYIYFEKKLNQLNLIYFLHMFIFITDQELWVRKLMGRIIGYDHSLDRKDILKLVYYCDTTSVTIAAIMFYGAS